MRRIKWGQAGSVCLLALCVTGCLSTGRVQTAQTLGQGNFEVSVDPGVIGVVGLPTVGPILHAAFRYGVTDRIDLGVRAGNLLGEIQSKFLLTQPENPNLAISIAPGAGVLFSISPVVNLYVPVPLLVGFKFGGPHELTLGPRIENTVTFDMSNTVSGALYTGGLGLSIGFAGQVTDTFRMLPELSAVAPLLIIGSDDDGSADTNSLGVVLYSFNLGFQFGSPRKKFSAPAAPPTASAEGARQ
ncbi:hypothetical protein [Polyangium sorediatum]|nr:hypothetical protein [Polyangium sorediatum]